MSKSVVNKDKSNGGKSGNCDSKSILNKPDCDNNLSTNNQPINTTHPVPSISDTKLPDIFNFQQSSKNGP